jgi:hypothetical protein
MTVISAQNVSDIASRIRGIVKGGGFTPMVSGIRLAATMITGAKARSGARQVFNVISDGQPNMPSPPEEAKRQTLEARDQAVKDGLDQLDAEGIGSVEEEPEFKQFLLDLAWPQPGVIAPPFPPGHTNGFVIIVKKFADLENALRQKLVATLNEPPVADPGPIPDGKPDTEPYKCNTGQTITLDGSGSLDPDGQIAKYEWDFNGDGTARCHRAKSQLHLPHSTGEHHDQTDRHRRRWNHSDRPTDDHRHTSAAAQSAAYSKLRDCSCRSARRPDGPARRLRVL